MQTACSGHYPGMVHAWHYKEWQLITIYGDPTYKMKHVLTIILGKVAHTEVEVVQVCLRKNMTLR